MADRMEKKCSFCEDTETAYYADGAYMCSFHIAQVEGMVEEGVTKEMWLE